MADSATAKRPTSKVTGADEGKKACVLPTAVNVDKWIQENEKFFTPPVCNKLMHGQGQLKIMFVGGPNVRRDFHINQGAELFYQIKGDMCLRIMEQGTPKDIIIKEGEVFVLPGSIPHSPQRFENTVGLVIERERLDTETDGLRYYRQSELTQPLWEKWFHCHDLGVQLGPVIKEYFASTEHSTDTPSETSVAAKAPVTIDVTTKAGAPFCLDQWLSDNAGPDVAKAALFSDGEFKVDVLGTGEHQQECLHNRQVWVWQKTGQCTVRSGDDERVIAAGDSLLIDQDTKFAILVGEQAMTLLFRMEPMTASSV
eukprot:m.186687 g.186687  ORF g.186687 m.186687 type:complete len:312 (+) comp14761_c1_seq2:143-1078(+)